jgi:hypothetical protein
MAVLPREGEVLWKIAGPPGFRGGSSTRGMEAGVKGRTGQGTGKSPNGVRGKS